MKAHSYRAVAPACTAAAILFTLPSTILAGDDSPGAWKVRDRGANHRRWESVQWHTNRFGRAVARPRVVTELAAGLHYRGADGRWVETQETIESVPGGAAAVRGPHRVQFARELNSRGAIQVTARDGRVVRSTPAALVYTDRRTGQSLMVAALAQGSTGEIQPPNQVVYPDAFAGDGFTADVRYTYSRAGLECDVILNGMPPDPRSLGFADADPDAVMLEVWTEFFDVNTPGLRRQVLQTARAAGAGRGAVPELADQTVSFGDWQLGLGRAFVEAGGRRQGTPVPVAKSWLDHASGRRFLIEAVAWRIVDRQMAGVFPPRPATVTAATVATRDALPPEPRAAGADTAPMRLRSLALNDPGPPRFVVDWVGLNSMSDVTLAGDETYWVDQPVVFTGNTVIEGGTVVKFSPGARIEVNGPLECRTAALRPAVFTAVDDDTVGEPVFLSSGLPQGYYAAPALQLNTGSADLSHLRISHAATGIDVPVVAATPPRLQHMMWLHSGVPVQAAGGSVLIRNGLAFDCQNFAAAGSPADFRVEHLTASHCADLGAGAGVRLHLTNSLLSMVDGFTGYDPANAAGVMITRDPGVLETAGGGSHYLAPQSPARRAGTTAINAVLATELSTRTTRAPRELAGVIEQDTILRPILPAGAGGPPDLGWHYPALDYLVSSLVVAPGRVLEFADGTAVGIVASQPESVLTAASGTFRSTGLPTRPNRMAQAGPLQEGNAPSITPRAWFDGYEVTAGQPSVMACRFTEFHSTAGGPPYLGYPNNFTSLAVQDCQIYGGRYEATLYGPHSQRHGWTNNLLWRVAAVHHRLAPQPVRLDTRNNLVIDGWWHLADSWDDGGSVLQDNVFDRTTVTFDGPSATATHNAHRTGVPWPFGTYGDRWLTSLTYATGPLGSRYVASANPTLANAGSRSASAAGLYHYTQSVTAGSREGATTVDIGFHYPALNASGQLLDADADGVADWFEDRDGDGTWDSGETAWQTPNNWPGGVTGTTGFLIFTPLR